MGNMFFSRECNFENEKCFWEESVWNVVCLALEQYKWWSFSSGFLTHDLTFFWFFIFFYTFRLKNSSYTNRNGESDMAQFPMWFFIFLLVFFFFLLIKKNKLIVGLHVSWSPQHSNNTSLGSILRFGLFDLDPAQKPTKSIF